MSQRLCTIFKKKDRLVVSQSYKYSLWLKYLGFKVKCSFYTIGGLCHLEGAISARQYFMTHTNMSNMILIHDNHYEKVMRLKKAEKLNPLLKGVYEASALRPNGTSYTKSVKVLPSEWKKEVIKTIKHLKN